MLISKTTLSMLVTSKQIVEDKKQCLVLAAFTAVSAYRVYQAAKAQDRTSAVMQFLDTLKLVYLDYNCLTQNMQLKELAEQVNVKDKQCFIDHFETALKDLGNVVLDVMEFNFSKVADDFNNVVATLQDALDNC